MSRYSITIKPLGLHAVLVEWPQEVEEEILLDILAFKSNLESTLKGDWEYVPAYNSLALINRTTALTFSAIEEILLEKYRNLRGQQLPSRNLWKLPVCYDEEFAPDMVIIEEKLGLSRSEIVKLHTSHHYTIYCIGFLPGFMYLGGLPEVLQVPRRSEPRLKVDKGSVGLAGKQTGIYPHESPGGWNIIGRCPVPMFNLKLDPPCFITVGDKVQFVEISRAEYNLHAIEADVGILKPEKEVLDA